MKTWSRSISLYVALLTAVAAVLGSQYSEELLKRVHGFSIERKRKIIDESCAHLPTVNRIEVFEMDKVKAKGNNGFLVRPHKIVYSFKKKVVIKGDAAEGVAQLWRSVRIVGLVAAGHDPDIGVKFYDRNNKLELETTLSWEAHNFWIGTGWGHYVWVPFEANSNEALRLRERLTSILREGPEISQ